MPKLLEFLGRALGWALAIPVWLGSHARRARVFHPRGIVFEAAVEIAPAAPGEFQNLGRKLSGPGFVRLSAALRRQKQTGPDVLGMAIRFGGIPGQAPTPDDQDLLFATVRSAWTLLV